ncbi:type-F conjugative transfer system protein TrbI [Escherichia coli]|uniref:type-F conjugative transfer system protein TrbI n=4 Tax=Escherichia coli TaxID=562 RepID=UPI003D9A810B
MKMPAFEWVHVQLHQQKGMISLSPPTICNSAKQTVDAFFDSASQKQLSEAQSKALSARFNTALEASLQAWQQKHHAVILVSPAVVQGAPDITREIQQDIARRMRAEP